MGRDALPEPLKTPLPEGTLSHNQLCQEASGVTYHWDTDSLFIVGDGGKSVTQDSTTGQLIDTMTLPLGGSIQGTDFLDTEGIAYIGGGEFVLAEEGRFACSRRQVNVPKSPAMDVRVKARWPGSTV